MDNPIVIGPDSPQSEDNPDVRIAVEALQKKQEGHKERWDYYEGRHPLRWSTNALKETFGRYWKSATFIENWLSVIVTTTLDRMELERIEVADNEAQTERLDSLFESLNLEIDAEDVMLDMLVTGEGYLIAWVSGEEGARRVDAYHNDSRNVQTFADPVDPRRTRMAAKWWRVDKHTLRLTLYYPDRIEYWTGQVKEQEVQGSFNIGRWTRYTDEPGAADGIAPNPYGMVPVFRFTTSRMGAGEMDQGIPIQDGINKIVSDLMVASDYAAIKQRWVVSDMEMIGKPPMRGNTLLQFTKSDKDQEPTQVGTFDATETSNFLNVIENKAQTLAVITSTPKHFFWTGAGTPSGEALIAMEAPLNRKVGRYQRRAGAVFSDFARFLLRLDGQAITEEDLIVPVWKPSETVQPRTRAEIREMNVRAGFPLVTQMREEGYTQAEINRMFDDRRMDQMNTPLPGGESQEEQADIRAVAVQADIQGAVGTAVQALADGLIDKLQTSGALARIVESRKP